MNPVLAGISLVLVAIFGALAFSRKRREQQNWRLLAGLAAVFAVALAASVFIPPFEVAPPADTTIPPGSLEPVSVVLEGVLVAPVAACGSSWCFALNVVDVISGPEELAAEDALEVRADAQVLLLADKRIRVSGTMQEDYLQAQHAEIFLVDDEGNAAAAQVAQPEVAPEEPQEFYVEIYGYPEGDWYGCGSRQCVEFVVLAENLNKGPIPNTVILRKNETAAIYPSALVYGLYSGGFVEVETVGVVNEPLP